MDQQPGLEPEGDRITNVTAEARLLLTYKIGLKIHLFYLPIISTVGFISNIIALCILLQEKNRKYPCYRTLTALSMSDLVIILSGVYNWIIHITDSMTETHCKIWTYFFQTAALSSALMVAFLTVHKHLAFVAPFRSHNLRSPSRTLRIIIGIVVSSFLYNITHIFGRNTIDNTFCVGITGEDGYNKALTWIALLLHAVSPVTFVTTLNTLTVRAVYLSGKFYQSSGRVHSTRSKSSNQRTMNMTLSVSSSPKETPNPKKQQKQPLHFNSSDEPKNPLRHYDRPTATYHRQSSVLLVSVTCVFAILSTPLYFCYLAYSFVNYRTSPEAYARYVLVFYICLDLYITNSCINFFLYMAAGTRFREDVKRLFKTKRNMAGASMRSGTHTSTSLRGTSHLNGSAEGLHPGGKTTPDLNQTPEKHDPDHTTRA